MPTYARPAPPDVDGLSDAPLWRAQLPGRPLTGLTILVVEDSRFASEAMRLLCLRSGARIRRAETLRAAARHLQTYRPAVVIVDLGLPDGNGEELIARLARLTPRVPVVLAMSGDDTRRDAAMDAGADGFLAKPIESLALFQQAVLTALPESARRMGLRLLPDDVIEPDRQSLREDLVHAAQALAQVESTDSIDYIARFLAGLARSSHDLVLEDAAGALARDHSAGRAVAASLARISGIVHDRIASAGGSA